MERVLNCVTILFFGLSIQNGNALFECPVPSNSSLIYFDLEALNSLALLQGYHTSIHSPLLCIKGTDEECKTQQCCPGEDGCCLSNSKNERHIRKCGCKKPLEKQCSFPAPYAILANSKCTSDQQTKITACLREKREDEYLVKQNGLKAKAKTHTIGDSKGDDGPLDTVDTVADKVEGTVTVVTDVAQKVEGDGLS